MKCLKISPKYLNYCEPAIQPVSKVKYLGWGRANRDKNWASEKKREENRKEKRREGMRWVDGASAGVGGVDIPGVLMNL